MSIASYALLLSKSNKLTFVFDEKSEYSSEDNANVNNPSQTAKQIDTVTNILIILRILVFANCFVSLIPFTVSTYNKNQSERE